MKNTDVPKLCLKILGVYSSGHSNSVAIWRSELNNLIISDSCGIRLQYCTPKPGVQALGIN